MKKLIAVIMIVSVMLGMSVTASFASELVLVNDTEQKSETRSFYWNGSDTPTNVCQTNWSGSFWTGYIKTQPKKSYVECQLPVLIPVRETRSFYWNGSDNPDNVCKTNWLDSIWTGSIKTRSNRSYVECQFIPIPGGGGFIHPPGSANIGG